MLGLLPQNDLQKELWVQKQCYMFPKLSCSCKLSADVFEMQVWTGPEILYFPQLLNDVRECVRSDTARELPWSSKCVVKGQAVNSSFGVKMSTECHIQHFQIM